MRNEQDAERISLVCNTLCTCQDHLSLPLALRAVYLSIFALCLPLSSASTHKAPFSTFHDDGLITNSHSLAPIETSSRWQIPG